MDAYENSLESVLNNENCIFLDNSILHRNKVHYFNDGISFSQKNEIIEIEKRMIGLYLKYSDKLRSTPEFLLESNRFKKLFKNQIKSRKAITGKYKINSIDYLDYIYSLEEYYRSLSTLLDNVKKNVFVSDDPNFEHLCELFNIISGKIPLKVDNDYFIGSSSLDRSKKNNHDERIISALVYNCMYSSNSPCLLTDDNDMKKIAYTSLYLLMTPDFKPYNERLIESIKWNPIRIYTELAGEIRLVFESNRIDRGEDYFFLRKSSILESKQARENIIKEFGLINS